MKSKLLTILLPVLLSAAVAATVMGIMLASGDEGVGSSYTIETAYAEAQDLGYSGTLDEFITLISGEDGVGIESISEGDLSVDGASTLYTINLTNGECAYFSVVHGKNGEDGVSVVSIKKTASSGLVDTYTITLSNGEETTFEITNGEDGADGADGLAGAAGTDGVGISNVYVNSDGELIIKLTDGTENNLGKINVTTDTDDDPAEPTYPDEDDTETSHSWDSGIVTKKATCTEAGERTYTCATCGKTKTEEIPATGHTYDTAKIVWTWNGYESATAKLTCEVCDDEQTVTATITNSITTAATCTTAGERTYTATVIYNGTYYTDKKTEIITASGHNYTTSVTEPTCQQQGYTTYECSNCGDSYTADYTAQTGHSYDTSAIVWTWNGYSSATAKISCKNCDDYKSYTATITNEVTTAATCAQKGVRTYTAAITYNGVKYTDAKTEEIAAIGHNYTNYVYNDDATCTADGTKTAACDNGCGSKDTVTAEGTKTGHTYDTSKIEWTWSGYSSATAKISCKNCDDYKSYSATITSEVTTAATCSQKGVKTYTASITYDGVKYTNTKTEEITAIGHSYTNYAYNGDATCTTDGTKTATCDNGCGSQDTITAEGTKTGHTYDASNIEWTWSGYSSATAKFTCKIGDDTQTVDAAITNAVTTAATCTTAGVRTYTATVLFNGTKYTDTKTEEIKATGHTWDSGKVTTAATCTAKGEKTYTCTVSGCGGTKTEEIAATGHTYDTTNIVWTWTDYSSATAKISCKNCTDYETVGATITSEVTTKATCTSTGVKTYTATITFEEKEYTNTKTETIAKTSHEYERTVTDPTCTEDGYTTYSCKNCTYSYTGDKTEATGHDYDENFVCNNCGDKIENVSVGLKYSLNTDGESYTVTGIGDCTDTDLVIYGTYLNKPVTAIAASAFKSVASTLTSIVIPDSVETIGASAFYGCTSLTSLTIGESVTSIGGSAFYNCYALTQLNYNATTVQDLAKSNNIFRLAGKNGTGITLNIGANVTSIPDNLFGPSDSSYKRNFTEIVFEEGSVLERIGDNAFLNCTAITKITLPSTVTYIGGGAFQNTAITKITIPSTVTYIGMNAFKSCSSLTSVTFEDAENWYYTSTSGATSGGTAISEDLSDSTVAATCLKTTYVAKYWYKEEAAEE